jgi:vacuolar-type H+-ATPase subunit F/Vma7
VQVAVIADELTAVGWALAGAQVFAASADTIEDCFKTARECAELVVLTAELAALLPQARLQEALESFPPLTLVIGDVRGRQGPPDLALEARRALGVAS